MLLPPLPFEAPLLEGSARRLTRQWATFLRTWRVQSVRAPNRVGDAVELTTQSASIAATTITQPTGSLVAGLYRVSYAARITTDGGTSHSLTVTIGWTHASGARSEAGAAMTASGATQSGTVMCRIDEATNITYATTYASVGSPAMVYQLDVQVERLQ